MVSTEQQLKVARQMMVAIYQTVAEAGDQGAPSGVIYTALATHGCSLQVYQSMLSALKQVNCITEDGMHILRANREQGKELGLE